MAVGKRRLRSLALGDRRFLWRCEFSSPLEVCSVGYRERGSSWPPDRLVVRPEIGLHCRLWVDWPPCQGPLVTPDLVRACVEVALGRGWLADSPTLDLAGSEVISGGASP